MLPREHGAYGQMAFPLVTAFAVAGVTVSAFLAGLAVVAGFLAHEPALVLLGRRGVRARREQQRAAAPWLGAALATAVASGIAAIWTAPPGLRIWFALPLPPAALLIAAIARRRENRWPAEVSAALAFSLAAVPVCLAAGARPSTAFSVAIPFALLSVIGTLAVRVVILKVRGGGDPRATAITRVAVLFLALLGTAGLAWAAEVELVRWSALLAAVPGLLTAAAVALRAPSATYLRSIGWTLVAVSLLAAVTIIVGTS